MRATFLVVDAAFFPAVDFFRPLVPAVAFFAADFVPVAFLPVAAMVSPSAPADGRGRHSAAAQLPDWMPPRCTATSTCGSSNRSTTIRDGRNAAGTARDDRSCGAPIARSATTTSNGLRRKHPTLRNRDITQLGGMQATICRGVTRRKATNLHPNA
ncbi:MAG: hypothetical protein M3415_04900 [Actinomycetota bacterium]|nr:hypothetical protein [Actinomycetota bacterium]